MKILIADDSSSVRAMLSMLLEQDGYEIIQARDGREGLEAATKYTPSIAVLDWEMPHLNGIEVCRRIRESNLNTMYIVMLTSKGESDSVVEGLNAGADDYLVKPFSPAELKARIRSGVRLIQLHEDKIKYHISMQQHQRMRSVGLLAAGIAHEINTPAQYLISNVDFLNESHIKLSGLMNQLLRMLELVELGQWTAEDSKKIRKKLDEIDINYFMEEVPIAIKENVTGIENIAKTVVALKNFAIPNSREKVAANINQLFENTIDVSRHRWMDTAEVKKEFQKDLRDIPCYPAEVNQLFLAILENAIDAVAEKKQAGERGRIVCRTEGKPDGVDIEISDDGKGMSPEILSRAFEPFFTTKPEGAGQGQGLTVAYDIVVNKHNGTISIESKENNGTTVKIHLCSDC